MQDICQELTVTCGCTKAFFLRYLGILENTAIIAWYMLDICQFLEHQHQNFLSLLVDFGC